MQDRIAIIDIGTNTVNLLLVDKKSGGYSVVHSNRTGVGLGHGGINNSIITKDTFKRGIDCLSNYATVCKNHNVTSIHAYGTSALRHASNANDFIYSVKKQSNIDIKILNGHEEANLIYKGIKQGFNFTQQTVIMDIGGGSTEFILADKKGIIKKHSLEIGVSRINQLFKFSNPFSKTDFLKIETYLDSKIGNQLDNFTSNLLIGSSGSFETFYELTYQKKYPKNKYVKIDIEKLKITLFNIANSTLSQRTANKFIIPIRRELIPIAAVKTLWVIKKINCKQLIVSPNSLKEGAIFCN